MLFAVNVAGSFLLGICVSPVPQTLAGHTVCRRGLDASTSDPSLMAHPDGGGSVRLASELPTLAYPTRLTRLA